MTTLKFLLFADVKGFSKLDPTETRLFFENEFQAMASVIKSPARKGCSFNTWGNGLFGAFDSAFDAAECGLDLCQFFIDRYRRIASHDNKLGIRVALHAGDCNCGKNPGVNRILLYI